MSKPRPIASGTLKLRELEIPVKLFSAAAARAVKFKLLHGRDLSRIQQKLYCPVDDAIVDRSELVRGFEVEKGKYVAFTEDELANLDDELIEITAFVERGAVDPVYFDSAYHIGCELAGVDAYGTLAQAMRDANVVAIAGLTMHGREHLAAICAIDGPRLMLYTLFYAGELHSSDGIDEAARGRTSAPGLELTKRLIEELRTSFEPAKYSDRYRERVIAAALAKLEGREVLNKKTAPRGAKSVDLDEQLRASLRSHKSARPKRDAGARKSPELGIPPRGLGRTIRKPA